MVAKLWLLSCVQGSAPGTPASPGLSEDGKMAIWLSRARADAHELETRQEKLAAMLKVREL